MALLSTAKKVATGLLDMDKPSRMARAKEQGFDTDAGYKNTIIGKVYDSISDFSKAASKGKVNQAREFDLDQRDILDGVMPATEFDFLKIDDDGIGLDYEMGTFNKRLEDAGLYVIDNRMGKVIAGKTKEDALNLQNAKSPIEYGKSYGYSDDDIAAFYSRRANFDNDLAYKEYNNDLFSNQVTKTSTGAGIFSMPAFAGALAASQSNDTYADYSPENLSRLRTDDVGSYQAAQSPQLARAAGLMGQVNERGVDDPLMGMVSPRIPSELMNKIAYNDKRGVADYLKAAAGLLGLY